MSKLGGNGEIATSQVDNVPLATQGGYPFLDRLSLGGGAAGDHGLVCPAISVRS